MPLNESASVSVVIPNYNGTDLLKKNLPSLYEALKDIDFEIIVVDDDSRDDSVDFLKNEYPNITIIKNSKNLGFSATCNKGINIAIKELACIVNTDVTFTNDYFINAFKNFTNPKIFAVKGDIFNYQNTFNNITNVERTSLLYFKRGFLRFNNNVEPKNTALSPQINSQFILLGCCFICRRKALQSLGGYNEIYSPFYWEDADLAQRALKSGFKLAYDKNCKVYHQTSSTISHHRSNYRRRLISNRNKFIFTWKHLSGLNNWALHILFTLINLLTRWVILDWKYYVAISMALYSITTNTSQQLNGN